MLLLQHGFKMSEAMERHMVSDLLSFKPLSVCFGATMNFGVLFDQVFEVHQFLSVGTCLLAHLILGAPYIIN